MGRKKVIVSVWEGNGKEIMRLVGMGGKWEGNYDIFWHCKEMGRKKYLCWWGKEMGRKKIFLLVWEGKRKEKIE